MKEQHALEDLYVFVKSREEEYELMECLQSKGYTWRSGHSPTDIPTFLQLPKDATGGMILSISQTKKMIRFVPAEVFGKDRLHPAFDTTIGMQEVREGIEKL